MPTTRTIRRDPQLTFEAIAIEGGLLSPEWLARVAQLDAGGQSEADYGVPKGLSLRDEIGRFWRIAQAHWGDFDAGRAASADPETMARTFVKALLRDAFGFTSLAERQPERIGERDYPVPFAALEGRAPIVVAPAGSGLEMPATALGDGTRRRSAFGLLQEYLNAADPARWGIATDGLTLRIGRDSASLTRPAWIEADLDRIFTEGRYADFAALWLLTHETRFGKPGEPVDNCPLERWREAGRKEGTRAREHLRAGVEQALLALGQGFLSHPENQSLRKALQDGTLTPMAYFQELLRLVYRLIFLLTIEERGLLHTGDVSDDARELYASGYSVSRLRDRSVRRGAHDRFADLWEGTKIIFKALATGEPRLGLPALSGLFDAEQCPNVDGGRLENRALLLAIFRLGWLGEASGLARVNWRDMGPEELGSVYESLLELVPQIAQDGRQFTFATGAETKGNARKTSGSYYTPDSLVQVLLDSALEPVVKDAIAAHPEDPVAALLQLSIVDPACGSGHFLLAAARRVAAHVARLRANGTPSVAEYQHALREIVGRCIYGVDLNPMAVELCRVSLWMEAVEPGLPLTFLGSHIQQGNALIGTTPELMAEGIPDEAWNPIEGDDRKVASALKRRNRAERDGQRSLIERWAGTAETPSDELLRAVSEVEDAPDTDMATLARKRTAWQAVVDSDAYRHQRLLADTWCAAFVWHKQSGAIADLAPTHQHWEHLRDSEFEPPAIATATVRHLADQYQFFHWHLQFPQVFARGGFDAVLGNPPWERLKIQDREWFAKTHPEVAHAGNAAERTRLISTVADHAPVEYQRYRQAIRQADGEAHFVRSSKRFQWGAAGDVNTYALFANAALSLTSSRGRFGLLLPLGIATDATYGPFFYHLVATGRLVLLLGFINERKLFPSVLHNFKFAAVVGTSRPAGVEPVCVFNCFTVDEAADPRRRFTLNADDLSNLNPETKTCPVFFWSHLAAITKAVYRRVPLLGGKDSGWDINFWTMFHMANDSHLFRRGPSPSLVPLYEGKMINQYNHRYASYGGLKERAHILPETPATVLDDPSFHVEAFYYVPPVDVAQRNRGSEWYLALREVTSAGLERTIIACILPMVAANHKLLMIKLGEQSRDLTPSLLACLNSIPFDFVARQKLGGASVAGYMLRQLPIPSSKTFRCRPGWCGESSLADWIRPRVLELTFTSGDLQAFAREFGHFGNPFSWNVDRRIAIRAELDAGLFHEFGFARDEVVDVFDTFLVLRDRERRQLQEFRSKRLVLQIYDEMAEAARTGQTYATRLDPPPAHRRVAHPDTHIEVV
jgi:hypothetical protein